MLKANRKLLTILMSLFFITNILSGCGKSTQETSTAQLVKTKVVSFAAGGAESTYAGEVRGRYEKNVSFQVGGKIIDRRVELGSMVHAGDVLMTIDGKDLRETANKSDAQVESAKSQLRLAESNLNRYTQLYQQAAISAAALDQYQTTYEAAQAAYDQARADAAQGQNAVGYASLTADTDGVISAVSAEAGQVVSAGQTVLTLVQTDELEVEINIPENRLESLPLGKDVMVSFWALNSTIKVPGVIREIAPMADQTTRTYKVRVRLPQPPAGLRLGMTASVDCADRAGNPDGTAILPLSAIYQTGDQPQVWVVNEDHQVALKNVSVEGFGNNSVKATGLSHGDIVVIAGVHKLREGQDVRLMEGADQ